MLRLRKFSSKVEKHLTIGIRREAKSRWERRVPLVPDQVERLIQEGAKVIIQPSTKRVIPTDKYREVGAIVSEDLTKADIIMGVKEVPISELIPNKNYIFFSHTIKGQSYNMNLLKEIKKQKIRLFDYELLTENDTRIVQFSKFAGYAGMVDGLHSLGHRLLAMGYGNPFLVFIFNKAIGMSYMYRNAADARLDVTRTGMVLMDEGLPKKLGPMIFVITGSGNVSKGAHHVLKCLPHETVLPENLEKLAKSKDFDTRKIYICHVNAKDYCKDKNGRFDLDEYYDKPELYKSVFHDNIMPYATFILNGIFWTNKVFIFAFLSLDQC
jgi:alpha-aminoadipic semialdehyde synthase